MRPGEVAGCIVLVLIVMVWVMVLSLFVDYRLSLGIALLVGAALYALNWWADKEDPA